MTGTMRINIEAIIQCFLIYLLLQYQGGRFLVGFGSSFFYSVVLIVCVIGIVVMIREHRLLEHFPKYFLAVLIMFIYLIVSIIYTNGGMTIATCISFVSRFLLPYMAVAVNPREFLNRFIKMVVVFAVISDVIYFSHFIGATPFWSSISNLFYRVRYNSYYAGDTYGLFFVVFRITDLTRNSYMFGEPGEYQIVINTALFFLLFWQNRIDFSKRKKIGSLIILLITLITIQSTSGFLALTVIVVCAILQNKKYRDKKIIRFLSASVIIAVIYICFFASDNSIFYTSIYNKIILSGHIDLAANTGKSRVEPFTFFVNNLQNRTLKTLFGVGANGLDEVSMYSDSVNGFINLIMIFGLIFAILISGYMIWKCFKYRNTALSFLTAIFIYFNQAFGQPDFMCILSVLILLYGYFYIMLTYENRTELRIV